MTGYRFAIEPPSEKYANFHAVTRAAQRGVCDQGCDYGHESCDDDSDFQRLALFEKAAHLAEFKVALFKDLLGRKG
jgi:hypothetical protein